MRGSRFFFFTTVASLASAKASFTDWSVLEVSSLVAPSATSAVSIAAPATPVAAAALSKRSCKALFLASILACSAASRCRRKVSLISLFSGLISLASAAGVSGVPPPSGFFSRVGLGPPLFPPTFPLLIEGLSSSSSSLSSFTIKILNSYNAYKGNATAVSVNGSPVGVMIAEAMTITTMA